MPGVCILIRHLGDSQAGVHRLHLGKTNGLGAKEEKGPNKIHSHKCAVPDWATLSVGAQ